MQKDKRSCTEKKVLAYLRVWNFCQTWGNLAGRLVWLIHHIKDSYSGPVPNGELVNRELAGIEVYQICNREMG